jgi:hypothetical protein
MSQSEQCVITCDGGCEATIVAEDWAEAHELAAEDGWTVTAIEDLCRRCS